MAIATPRVSVLRELAAHVAPPEALTAGRLMAHATSAGRKQADAAPIEEAAAQLVRGRPRGRDLAWSDIGSDRPAS